MSEAIIDALRAMQSDLRQVEMLSQNIANQGTPGYRAVETTARPFDVGGTFEPQRAESPLTRFSTSAGPLIRTDSEFDIAVTDGGFLEVEGGRAGRTALVRGGTIMFDDVGRPTISGRALVTSAPDRSNASSELSFSAQAAGASSNSSNFLQAVAVSDTSTLKLVAPGVYEIDSEFVAVASNRTSVLQGYLEQSNVNSSQVVVQMMELSKHVESVQRAMRAIDEMLGSGINELGR